MTDAPHRFDEMTDWCVVCGCSHVDFVDGYRPSCDVYGNVTGVSHIIARKRFEALLAANPDVVCLSSIGPNEQHRPA